MDMYVTDIANFQNKVFKMVDLQNDLKYSLNNAENIFNNTNLNIKFKYVQIKRKKLEGKNYSHDLLQIIDISAQIMYNVVNGEKKLMALINATVSHEMRNPINSIKSQNLFQKQLNQMIRDLINDSNIKNLSEFKR